MKTFYALVAVHLLVFAHNRVSLEGPLEVGKDGYRLNKLRFGSSPICIQKKL